MSTPFDLEKAISAWRRPLEQDRTFCADDLDELEESLRDRIRSFVESGMPEAKAFEEALLRMGSYGVLEEEYRKVRWDRRKRKVSFRSEVVWRAHMLRSYLTVALRTFRRQRLYTGINVAGLAIALATCLMIALFVRDELSYDRFHKNAHRLFRVVRNDVLMTSALLGPSMERDFAAVEHAVRISTRYPEILVRHDGESQYEDRFYFTDSTFFDVFTFPLITGNPKSALTDPFTVVLSEEMARKYFGDEDPVGRTLSIKGLWDAHDYRITGVARNAPHNSHFKFSFLASYESRFKVQPNPEDIEHWRHVGDITYVLVHEGRGVEELAAQMPDFVRRYEATSYTEAPPQLYDAYGFQPVTDIHLHSNLPDEFEPGGDVRYLYVFSGVGLLILLMAGINYVNLATARSVRRAREVGIRKVVGAQRGQLVTQFLSESLIVTVVALAGAVLLVWLSLPIFNSITGKPLSFGIGSSATDWLTLAAAGLLAGLLAGGYPALFLSGFQPVRVLKGLVSRRSSNVYFRNSLTVVQLVASVALIAGTVTIQRQLEYMRQQKLGLNPEQVLEVSTRSALGRSYEAFKTEIMKHPGVASVSASSHSLPTGSALMNQFYLERDEQGKEPIFAYDLSVGMDFLETMQIPLIKGRDFNPGDFELIRGRQYTPVIVNEAAVERFDWDEPLGQEFDCCLFPTPRVVGVVEDFNFNSLKEEIAPLALSPTWWSQEVLVRVSTDDLPGTIAFIRNQWEAFAPGLPFEYSFVDEQFDQAYTAEERVARVFGVFSGLAILMACLGLFGLAAFAAEQRTKEIGIRKVLGASVANISVLLSQGFVRLVLYAVMIAAPLAYIGMERWLQHFPYRVDVSAGPFVMATLTALGLVLVSVGYHAVRAALATPVDSIRYE